MFESNVCDLHTAILRTNYFWFRIQFIYQAKLRERFSKETSLLMAMTKSFSPLSVRLLQLLLIHLIFLLKWKFTRQNWAREISIESVFEELFPNSWARHLWFDDNYLKLRSIVSYGITIRGRQLNIVKKFASQAAFSSSAAHHLEVNNIC